jgi:hypothetical protein
LGWSQGGTADDIRLVEPGCLDGKILVYTEKLDGENTVCTRDVIHARSETGYGNPWQTWMKGFWSRIRSDIPAGFTICGESMYAVHSIEYTLLDSYFYVFGILEGDRFLSWEDTKTYCALIGLQHVPELHIGPIMRLGIPRASAFGPVCEGYVVRNIESFDLDSFSGNVAKCVRANHVQTDVHWSKNWKKHELFRRGNVIP